MRETVDKAENQEYWDRVEASLDMLGTPKNEALRVVEDFREKVSKLSEQQRDLLFNAEPINLAADLAGLELDKPTIERYIETFKSQRD